MFTVTLCYAVHVVRIVKMSKGVRHSRNLASFSLMKSGERSEKCNYGNHANYGDSPGTRNYHKTREMDVFIASFVIALTHFPSFFRFLYLQICKHKLCISSRLFICKGYHFLFKCAWKSDIKLHLSNCLHFHIMLNTFQSLLVFSDGQSPQIGFVIIFHGYRTLSPWIALQFQTCITALSNYFITSQ